MKGGHAPKPSQNDKALIKAILPELREQLIEPITASIEKSLSEKVPNAVDHSVNVSIAKTWAAAVGEPEVISEPSPNSDDPETNFSIVVSKRQRKEAAAQIKAIKEVATQQRLDEGNREERLKNVMLFKVPEQEAESAEEKQKKDCEYVENLLKVMKVNNDEDNTNGGGLAPKKVYRLGKFDRSKTYPRPIKVEFETKMDANLIMTNAKYLKNAPEAYKSININYDLTETDREELGTLLSQAKDKTKNSTEFIWKVRGPPGKMALQRFPKQR